MNSENANHAGNPSAPSLAEVIEVIRPQVEKIEEGFKAIRITLDALAEHLGAMPPVPAENRRGPAPATKEPAIGRGAAADCRPEDGAADGCAGLRSARRRRHPRPGAASVVLPPLAQPMAAPVVAIPAAAPVAQAARPATASGQPQPTRAGSIPATGPRRR